MKKEKIYDYSVNAFAEYSKYIKSNSLHSEKKSGYLEDMKAVEKTLEYLKSNRKDDILAAVNAVYMHALSADKAANQTISLRVRRFAVDYPADERTVYKWLKQARYIFAGYRGLNIS
jgi:hypothetical protein